MYLVICIYYKYWCVDTSISEDLPADDSGNQLDTDVIQSEPIVEREAQCEIETEAETEPKTNTETESLAQTIAEAESESIAEREVEAEAEAEVPTRTESLKDETAK